MPKVRVLFFHLACSMFLLRNVLCATYQYLSASHRQVTVTASCMVILTIWHGPGDSRWELNLPSSSSLFHSMHEISKLRLKSRRFWRSIMTFKKLKISLSWMIAQMSNCLSDIGKSNVRVSCLQTPRRAPPLPGSYFIGNHLSPNPGSVVVVVVSVSEIL